jgi:hypothetical protein
VKPMTMTTIEVSARNRDRLAAIASSELNGASLDHALDVLLFEHESFVALARLTPEQLAEMRDEAWLLAESEAAVPGGTMDE